MNQALKANFEKYCAAHNLRTKYDALPGCAKILKRKGLYNLEVTCVSNCKYVPGSTGYLYPVIGLTEAAMNDFLASALYTEPTVSFKTKNGEIVGKF